MRKLAFQRVLPVVGVVTLAMLGFSASAMADGGSCTGTGQTSISSNFNGTPITAGHVIWFTADLTGISGLPSSGGTIEFTNQQITGVPGVSGGTVNVPDSIITFSPGASASAVFNTIQDAWEITLPTNFGGEGLLAAFPVVDTGGTSGGGTPTWSGTLVSNTASVSMSWQWQAATYDPGFPTNPSQFNSLGVVAANAADTGTPANETSLKDGGGATGGGGSNFTGSHSGTVTVCSVPKPSCTFVITTNSQGQNTQATITVQDPVAGIESIVLVSNSNDTVNIPSFTPGTTSPVVVTAVKTDLTRDATVDLTVTNTVGQSTTCDPAFARVNRARAVRFRGLKRQEHFVTIFDQKRGLRSMTVVVNGKRFVVRLHRGQRTRLNVARAMHAGRHNWISFHGSGRRHGAAVVMVTNRG